MSNPYRIIFMGSPDFAIPTLKALYESEHEVISVYCQPPKPSGRGQKINQCAIHQYAESCGLDVQTPKNFKQNETIEQFQSYQADIAIVAAYGLLLPKAVLNATQYGCINIHGSLLPKWRGAAPIQYAVLSDDKETGVTIMKMDKGLDTGDMILKSAFPITPNMMASTCFETISELGASDTLKVLSNLDSYLSKAKKQDDAHSTHAPKLKKEDGLITFEDAKQIHCQYRALTPWPGTYFMIEGQPVKIKKLALMNENTAGKAGEIIDHSGLIQCTQGQIQLLEIQPANKKPMPFEAYLNGRQTLEIGSCLI